MHKFFFLAALLLSLPANAKTIRASELSSTEWSEISKGKEVITVEFRLGDELPVSFSAKGDFLETSRAGVSYVKVKKSFWLRLEKPDELDASLDGITFKPLKDIANGSFEAGAGQTLPGVPVNAINLVLTAVAK